MTKNEELIKLFKKKYKLTEEQSDEIISIVKANINKRIDDNCAEMINITDKLNTKYAGKIVYFNRNKSGCWICDCEKVVYDVNADCIRFEGSRFVLLSENHDIGYGYALVESYADDGAEYFGPYGGRSVTHSVMEAIRLTLKLPGCSKQFPRDIGKERPCLNYHIKQCDAPCQGYTTKEEYEKII